MPANLWPSSTDLLRFGPEILLTLVGTLMMVLEPLLVNKRVFRTLSLVTLLGAIGVTMAAHGVPGLSYANMIIVDGFATFFRLLVLGVAILTVLLSGDYLEKEGHETGEFYALLLFSVVGQGIMACANELIMVFVGIEISSIASYILTGYLRDDKRNNEAAMKYFLLGSFATAFLLYGVAWIYGLTGSTNLNDIRTVLSSPNFTNSASLVGMSAALMFVGFAFKVSAAPFQSWAPDVYQGAPSPVSAFMSAGPKAAAFAVFIRVFLTAYGPISDTWVPLVGIAALATMTIGNFAALRQTNVKRLLAYSSIAHAGYVLVAIAAHSTVGTQAVMFYLASYVFMNVGAFAVVTYFARKGEQYVNIDDLSGLAVRQPAMAAMLTIFMLSLIGVPLTAGFFGKFYIFKAALDSNLVWLTILGLLNSAVAAYYYLRILVVMYMREPGVATNNMDEVPFALRLTVWASALATLVLGVMPGLLLDVAGRWVLALGR
jgi:NADH-quinone oxidoreductase subunit N